MVLRPFRVGIIPLREMEGNYNQSSHFTDNRHNYTLERDGRELQLVKEYGVPGLNYTLERDGRELQRTRNAILLSRDYTLERDGRELQRKD